MSSRAIIDQILSCRSFAVSGASRDSSKYGFKVYAALKRAGYRVYAINPNAGTIDGDTCYPHLDNVPSRIDCLVTVTQPEVTEATIRDAGKLHIPYLWMQPGSESLAAFNCAQANFMQIVSGGPCIMVAAAAHQARAEAEL